MKALITGSAGFIGKHLSDEFYKTGYEVICCDLKADDGIIPMDVMNVDMIDDVLRKYSPDIIVNLAGQANVGLSWKKPQLTVELNTVGLINILESVRKKGIRSRVVAIGSSDEYGKLGELGKNVTEELSVNPINPYSISKYVQELFASLYVNNFGMDVCMVRLFNLGGAGQSKGFMISDFSSGIVEVEIGKKEYLSVGNLDSARDFTHVKDACRAIRLISEKGHVGEIYNICSGKTYKAQDILNRLIKLSKVNVSVIKDPSRIRPSDTPVICGNHDKLTEHTGWIPEMDIDRIIKDALDYWRIEYSQIYDRSMCMR